MNSSNPIPTHDLDAEVDPTSMFHGGALCKGKSITREVVDDDHACEYSLQNYLAAATAGLEVGVGQLHCEYRMSPEEYAHEFPDLSRPGNAAWVQETNVIYVPDVGVWLCAPVFTSLTDAYEEVKAARHAFSRALGVETASDLPVNFALIAMGRVPREHLRGVDLRHFYDQSLFTDVVGTLTARARPRPDDLTGLIDAMLGTGYWQDAKNGYYDDWVLPTWLDEMLAAGRPRSVDAEMAQ